MHHDYSAKLVYAGDKAAAIAPHPSGVNLIAAGYPGKSAFYVWKISARETVLLSYAE